MAIYPHCQSSLDAVRTSVHFKLASEDIILKLKKRSKLNQVELLTLCSPVSGLFTSAAAITVTCPVCRGRGQTRANTCPARCCLGSLPGHKIRFIIFGDANSLMPVRVETASGLSVNPNTVDLLLYTNVGVRGVHSLSHRLSSSADIVFTDWCLISRSHTGSQTGSQMLGCRCVRCRRLAARCYLLVTGLCVIPSRWSGPDESEPSYHYRDIHVNIYHDSMPGCCDGLIKTDYMTDHWQRPLTKPDLLYTGKAHLKLPINLVRPMPESNSIN